MNYVLTAEASGIDSNGRPIITLKYGSNNQQLFEMRLNKGTQYWTMLFHGCMQTTNVGGIDWNPPIGKTYIKITSGGIVEFCVGNDDPAGGTLIVTIPASSCASAFGRAAYLTAL